MNNKTIKDNVLKLIELKTQTTELIDSIYHESGDICLKIYSEDPVTIFVENPRGLELLSKIFKKRIITSDEKLKGEYPIKKFFCYKNVEFFCLYKSEKINRTRKEKLFNTITSIVYVIKAILTFAFKVLKIIGKAV